MNNLIVFIIISLFMSVICFISTNDILIALIVLVLSILFFILIANSKFKKYKTKVSRFHSCYLFINNYIVALSIKKSLKSALDSTSATLDDEFSEIYNSISDFDELDKLKYLGNYYKFDLYLLFTDLIKLWSEEGGDILSMSHNLVNSLRECEEYLTTCETIHKKILVEFAILWTFTFVILLVLRFALSQFYFLMLNQLFFKLGILAIFIFSILSFYIVINKVTNIELKGWTDDEK